MRNSYEWTCIICGGMAYKDVICPKCKNEEMNKQRAEPESLTNKQFRYIEYLMSKLDNETVNNLLYTNVSEYSGSIEDLSMNEAGRVIAKLLVACNK